jgi:hypothetical protein
MIRKYGAADSAACLPAATAARDHAASSRVRFARLHRGLAENFGWQFASDDAGSLGQTPLCDK